MPYLCAVRLTTFQNVRPGMTCVFRKKTKLFDRAIKELIDMLTDSFSRYKLRSRNNSREELHV